MAAEAFAALNRMLESRERRREAERSMALTVMAFESQQKMANVQLAGTQIENLRMYNAEMMSKVAQDFMGKTALGIHYRDDASGEGMKEGVEDLEKYMSPGNANEVAAAIWAHMAGNPTPILEIAGGLKPTIDAVDRGEKITPEQRELLQAFRNKTQLWGGPEGSPSTKAIGDKLVENAQKVLRDQSGIMEEWSEFGAGDFDITRKFGLQVPLDTDEPTDVPIAEGLAKPFLPTPTEMLATSQSVVEATEDEYDRKQNSLNVLDTESISLKELQRKGVMTDEQREYLSRIPDIKMNLTKELDSLTNAIEEAKTEVTKSRMAKGEERMARLSRLMEKSPSYLAY